MEGANLSRASQTITMGNVLNLGAGERRWKHRSRPSNVNQYAPILSKRQKQHELPAISDREWGR